MSELLSGKYTGFISSAYAATFLILAIMIAWVWLVSRSRKAELAKLEADGLRRAGSKT